MFDHKGNPLPTVMHFNYIGTPFTNEVCDVDKLLVHLKKHEWVINKEELIVDHIPYYNNEGGWRKEIKGENTGVVSILPSAKVLKEVYEISKKMAKGERSEFWSVDMKPLLLSGQTWTWDPGYKGKDKGTYKDYMGIRKFYAPRKETYEY